MIVGNLTLKQIQEICTYHYYHAGQQNEKCPLCDSSDCLECMNNPVHFSNLNPDWEVEINEDRAEQFNLKIADRVAHKLHPDMVNHPDHYKSHNGLECIESIEAVLGDSFPAFLQGNVLKYCWRADKKNGIEDLQKAKWYLERLIEYRKNDVNCID